MSARRFARENTGAPWRQSQVSEGASDIVRRMRDAGVAAEPQETVGRQSLMMLVQARRLPWRGQLYHVEPVPYQRGLKMDTIVAEMGQHTDRTPETLAAVSRLVRDLMKLFKRCVRPRGWRARVWWLTRNPFRNASDAEIKALLDFFYLCRRTPSQDLPAPLRN